jgi:hypothetical protein
VFRSHGLARRDRSMNVSNAGALATITFLSGDPLDFVTLATRRCKLCP